MPPVRQGGEDDQAQPAADVIDNPNPTQVISDPAPATPAPGADPASSGTPAPSAPEVPMVLVHIDKTFAEGDTFVYTDSDADHTEYVISSTPGAIPASISDAVAASAAAQGLQLVVLDNNTQEA